MTIENNSTMILREDKVMLTIEREKNMQLPYSIHSIEDAEKLVEPILERMNRETFICVSFDSRMHPISYTTVGIGWVDCCAASVAEVMKFALLTNAKAIIVAHNHPSGDPTPSSADDKVTKTIANAGALFEIRLQDHIIIGNGTGLKYSYLRQNGKLLK